MNNDLKEITCKKARFSSSVRLIHDEKGITVVVVIAVDLTVLSVGFVQVEHFIGQRLLHHFLNSQIKKVKKFGFVLCIKALKKKDQTRVLDIKMAKNQSLQKS
jgi:hypothetical protein